MLQGVTKVYHLQDTRHIKKLFFYIRAGTAATLAPRIFRSLCKSAVPNADSSITECCTAKA